MGPAYLWWRLHRTAAVAVETWNPTAVTILLPVFVQCQAAGHCYLNGESVWITTYLGNDMTDISLSEKYVASLYFLMSTLVGTGFGDITAVNDAERCFLLVTFVIGTMSHTIIFANVAAQIEGSGLRAYVLGYGSCGVVGAVGDVQSRLPCVGCDNGVPPPSQNA